MALHLDQHHSRRPIFHAPKLSPASQPSADSDLCI